jgi:nitroimidazol reductase NimA-like FMN-containing flavoprotein (pyridoxamine 5'-phosphate oxidase superfamily)
MAGTRAPLRSPTRVKNLDGYGAPPISWGRVRDTLDEGFTQAPETGGPNRHTCWLATAGSTGRPHVTAVGMLYRDGVFYFNSGPRTAKSRNLARDPRCSLSLALKDFDLVVEGRAVKVTDHSEALEIAEMFRAQGWPAEVEGHGASLTAPFSAPSAGPPPWDIYRVEPERVVAVGTSEPYGATRFDL